MVHPRDSRCCLFWCFGQPVAPRQFGASMCAYRYLIPTYLLLPVAIQSRLLRSAFLLSAPFTPSVPSVLFRYTCHPSISADHEQDPEGAR